jgi:hypothetical protein
VEAREAQARAAAEEVARAAAAEAERLARAAAAAAEAEHLARAAELEAEAAARAAVEHAERAAAQAEASERAEAVPDQVATSPSAPEPLPLLGGDADDEDLARFEQALDNMIMPGDDASAPVAIATSSHDMSRTAMLRTDEEAALDEDHGESTQIGGVPDQFTFAGMGAARASAAEIDADAELAAALQDANATIASTRAQSQDYGSEPAGQMLDPGYTLDAALGYPGDDAAPRALEADELSEEISDVDVLAEADASDADLLVSNGEADASNELPRAALGLDDIDDVAAARGRPQRAARAMSEPDMFTRRAEATEYRADPRASVATLEDELPSDLDRYARAQSEAGTLELQPEAGALEFDEPHGFATRTPPGGHEPAERPSRPSADLALESALEGLDPDVDVRASDPALAGAPDRRSRPTDRPAGLATTRAVRPAQVHATAATRPKRVPTEDDGVMIDFDDDE